MTQRLSLPSQLIVAIALLAASATLAALPSSQQVPARDASAPSTTGSAAIVGTLVSDDAAAQPIRRATVSLNGVEARRTFQLSTNDQGQFAFSSLPAGHYSLSASRLSYAPSYYGARPSWKSPGTSIVLAEGQRLTVAMQMMHGAVIAGTITDAYGRPQPGVRIATVRFRTVGGERQVELGSIGGGGTTDDLGGYRMFGLLPGEYGIGASILSTPETRQVTAAEIQWAQQQLRGAPTVIGSNPLVTAPASTPVGYAPIFYPGTPDPSAAAIITLGPGEVRVGVDFPLQWVATSRVEGTVIDIDGRPAAQVTLSLIRKISVPMLTPFGSGPSRTDSAGKFSFSSVLPGEYQLFARGATPPAGRAAGAPAPPVLWAQQEIRATGTDITGLSLQLQPGLAVSGRLAFDGSIAPPDDLTKVRVSLSPAPGSGVAMSLGTPQMNADGTFVVQGATPGRYRVNAGVPGPAPAAGQRQVWYLSSVTVNGVETLDSFLEIGTGDLSGVVATFTDHPTELDVSLVDVRGRPASDYWIVVFSSDRRFWTAGSRRVRTARPDAEGKLTIVGLPPGEYFTAGLTDLAQSDTADPAFLEQLASASVKITLADGEKKKQDLKLSGGSRD